MKRRYIKIVAISLLFVGCGGENTATTNTEATPTHTAINNKGAGVEGKMDNYTVKLFANGSEEIKPQERHQGVVVKFNGKTSETMAIQASYKGKEITAGIYDGDKLVKMSESISITDIPVVIIDIK